MTGIELKSVLAQGQIFAPVDLRIPNIQQETPVWCWLAVAEQIIFWKQGASPSQAELAAIANGFPAGTCENPPNLFALAKCARTGQAEEIQTLISTFGGATTAIAPPAHPGILYAALKQGRAIILRLQTTPFQGHVVVLRGLIPSPDPLLLVNDPIGWTGISQFVPFSRILGLWHSAIVVS